MMDGRPIIVVRLTQIVGWACFVIGIYLAVRTLGTLGSGRMNPFGMPMRGSFDTIVMILAPSLLLMAFGLIAVISAYRLDIAHATRVAVEGGKRET